MSPLISPPAGSLTATPTDKRVCLYRIRRIRGKFNRDGWRQSLLPSCSRLGRSIRARGFPVLATPAIDPSRPRKPSAPCSRPKRLRSPRRGCRNHHHIARIGYGTASVRTKRRWSERGPDHGAGVEQNRHSPPPFQSRNSSSGSGFPKLIWQLEARRFQRAQTLFGLRMDGFNAGHRRFIPTRNDDDHLALLCLFHQLGKVGLASNTVAEIIASC